MLIRFEHHIQVNVRVGRAGYYNRTTSMEKQVAIAVERNDKNLDLSPEAPQQIYDKAVKEALPVHDTISIDALSLPFFRTEQIGGAARAAVQDAAPSLSQIPLPDAPRAAQPDEDADQLDETEQDDSHAYTGHSFSELLPLAKPKAKSKATPKAPSKASVKAAPKAKADSSTASNASNRKRKDAPPVPEFEAPIKSRKIGKGLTPIERLAETMEDTSGPKHAADQEIVNEWQKKLDDFKPCAFATLTDTDAGIMEGLRDVNKDLTTFVNSLKKKIKSVSRRKTEDQVKPQLEEILQEANGVVKLCTDLRSMVGDEMSHVRSIQALSEMDKPWTFGKAVWKRAFKCAMTSFLKYSDWNSMTSNLRAAILSTLGDVLGNDFFGLLVNETVQRLIRSLNVAKALVD